MADGGGDVVVVVVLSQYKEDSNEGVAKYCRNNVR